MTFDKQLHDKPYSGRVWVYTSSDARGEPRFGPNWFRPSPLFGMDVQDWQPGTPLVFDDTCLGFPCSLDSLDPAGLRVQAVMALNPDARMHGRGVGNGYSAVVDLDDSPRDGEVVKLTIDKKVKGRKPPRSDRIKPFDIESKLLSRFHGRRIEITGAVILPEEYAERADDRFPAMYIFPGFGQTRETATMYVRKTGDGDAPMVQVLLDCDCATGLHEFADSENNGPCGQALIEEVIPHLEKNFRLIREPTARFTTGHSSGGWASLWAQITYPDYFGGCWSTSPDPVDFRDFTNVNIYEKNGNAFKTPDDKPRPLARQGGNVAITFRQFSDMDHVVGMGEQLGSFEAVFSPRGKDGKPMPLWNRKSGALDSAVAKAWEKYDIRLVLERNWQTLGPKLAGKINVYVGDQDTFYLNGAVKLLAKSQEQLGSDADIRILKGYDHGSIYVAKELREIPTKASRQFRKHHPDKSESRKTEAPGS